MSQKRVAFNLEKNVYYESGPYPYDDDYFFKGNPEEEFAIVEDNEEDGEEVVATESSKEQKAAVVTSGDGKKSTQNKTTPKEKKKRNSLNFSFTSLFRKKSKESLDSRKVLKVEKFSPRNSPDRTTSQLLIGNPQLTEQASPQPENTPVLSPLIITPSVPGDTSSSSSKSNSTKVETKTSSPENGTPKLPEVKAAPKVVELIISPPPEPVKTIETENVDKKESPKLVVKQEPQSDQSTIPQVEIVTSPRIELSTPPKINEPTSNLETTNNSNKEDGINETNQLRSALKESKEVKKQISVEETNQSSSKLKPLEDVDNRPKSPKKSPGKQREGEKKALDSPRPKSSPVPSPREKSKSHDPADVFSILKKYTFQILD